ncbi:hypothetical protein PG995_007001 [Apiospora arundinis]
MAVQLPHEVHGIAAGVLLYSFAGLICSALVVWLTWSHRERTSYIALIGYLLLASTATAVASQLHTFIAWEDVATAQWKKAVAYPRNPEQIISNGAVGGDLTLWYFRQYAFSAASMLFVFWAFALLQSIYGWTEKPHMRATLKRVNDLGKGTSIILPIITICSLQAKSVQQSVVVFMLLANVVLMISLAGGSGFMLAILVRYIQSRRQLLGWDVRYRDASSSYGLSASMSQSQGHQRRTASRGIYDRWLMTRFTIAFFILGIFELSNMLFQFTGMQNSNKDASRSSPDTSIARAKETAVLFMPGPAPSFLLFIVFGTTAPFRDYIYRTFVPKCWQREKSEGKRAETQGSQQGAGPNPKDAIPALPRKNTTPQFKPIGIPRQLEIPLRDLEKGLSTEPKTSSDDECLILPIQRPRHSYLRR